MRNPCESRGRLSAYLDGELTAEQHAAVQRHLAACAECASVLDDLRRISAGLRDHVLPALSDHGLRRLHERTDAFSHRALARLAGWLYAVAACLAIASGISLMRSTDASAAPASWEGAAVQMTEDSPTPGSHEAAIAEWMVTDLSSREAPNE